MLPEIRNYLDEVRLHLHLDSATERRIVSELYSYFQEKIAELKDRGFPEKEAASEAIKSFGGAKVVARLLYEAHSKGEMTEAILSSFPHLLVASLFAFQLWRNLSLGLTVLISIVCVTLFGWWRGKPNWLYSWIGYSWLPLLVAGYAAKPVLEQTVAFLFGRQEAPPAIWALLLTLALIAFSLWAILKTTIRAIRRDWVLASYMLVTLPIFASWLFNIERVGGLFQDSGPVIHQWDTPMALALAMLGVTSAAFILLRRRVLKVGVLLVIGSISLAMVGNNLWGGVGLFGLLGISLCMSLFLLIPAYAENRIGHGEESGEAWWSGDWIQRPSATR